MFLKADCVPLTEGMKGILQVAERETHKSYWKEQGVLLIFNVLLTTWASVSSSVA